LGGIGNRREEKMTTALALEYIPRRMRELGFESDYYIRFRHLVLKSSEEIELDAFNQIYILIEEAQDCSIRSDFGIYDTSFTLTNEQQYEHQGTIRIKNQRSGINHVRFIQVIPKHVKR
jgi:hypothetical protein